MHNTKIPSIVTSQSCKCNRKINHEESECTHVRYAIFSKCVVRFFLCVRSRDRSFFRNFFIGGPRAFARFVKFWQVTMVRIWQAMSSVDECAQWPSHKRDTHRAGQQLCIFSASFLFYVRFFYCFIRSRYGRLSRIFFFIFRRTCPVIRTSFLTNLGIF